VPAAKASRQSTNGRILDSWCRCVKRVSARAKLLTSSRSACRGHSLKARGMLAPLVGAPYSSRGVTPQLSLPPRGRKTPPDRTASRQESTGESGCLPIVVNVAFPRVRAARTGNDEKGGCGANALQRNLLHTTVIIVDERSCCKTNRMQPQGSEFAPRAVRLYFARSEVRPSLLSCLMYSTFWKSGVPTRTRLPSESL
jgi:hypothetical protein